MVAHRLLIARRVIHRSAAVALAIGLAARCTAGFGQAPDPEFSLELPLHSAAPAECAYDPGDSGPDPGAVIALMKSGAEQAIACAEYLDGAAPGWQAGPRASELVSPFVSYLLGDGRQRGLHRHAIFIALLGHLEKIDPGWRYSDSLDDYLTEMILGSVVEDPFVADFWLTTLEEKDPNWRESEAARAAVSELYERALREETNPEGPRNDRPRMRLKELSWSRHARLILATRVLDTWPKRVAALMTVILLLAFAARAIRRKRHA